MSPVSVSSAAPSRSVLHWSGVTETSTSGGGQASTVNSPSTAPLPSTATLVAYTPGARPSIASSASPPVAANVPPTEYPSPVTDQV